MNFAANDRSEELLVHVLGFRKDVCLDLFCECALINTVLFTVCSEAAAIERLSDRSPRLGPVCIGWYLQFRR